jgi:hypothetical protein
MQEGERQSTTTLYAFVAVLCLLLGVGFVIRHYGGASIWPGLVATLVGTLVAFVLALAWDRKRDRRQNVQTITDLNQQRTTEARRRFAVVHAELKHDASSLDELVNAYSSRPPGDFVFLLPRRPLLDGAWAANASRLSELVAEYDLISELANIYGRIEDLRWRLRFRSENPPMTQLVDTITVPLVSELQNEVAGLIDRVGEQVASPNVQRLGLLHTSSLSATIHAGATIGTKVNRASDSAADETNV